MTTSLADKTDALEAALSFLRPMRGLPVAYQYDPPPGVPRHSGENEIHRVRIDNARPLAADLSVDREGFELVRAPKAPANFFAEQVVCRDYYPEVERVLEASLGARQAIVFDHNVRSNTRALRGEHGVQQPVPYVHNDFTERSGPERARAELERRGLDADRLLAGRFALVNLWRPIGRPVEKSPLTLCDAASITVTDLVAYQMVYRDRIGETYALCFNPAQRWFYFPRMDPDEAILIKCYDSQGGGTARFTAHSAFDDPKTGPEACERESIEARALVLYP